MKLLFSFVIFFIMNACTQEKMQIYKREDFQIKYPLHLELEEFEKNKEGAVFILKTKKENDDDNFIENINLAKKEIKDIVLKDYLRTVEIEISSITKSIIESRYVKNENNDYLRFVFNVTQKGTELTFIQHYYEKNDVVYVLTLSTESSKFDRYFDEMNRILLSFKLI